MTAARPTAGERLVSWVLHAGLVAWFCWDLWSPAPLWILGALVAAFAVMVAARWYRCRHEPKRLLDPAAKAASLICFIAWIAWINVVQHLDLRPTDRFSWDGFGLIMAAGHPLLTWAITRFNARQAARHASQGAE